MSRTNRHHQCTLPSRNTRALDTAAPWVTVGVAVARDGPFSPVYYLYEINTNNIVQHPLEGLVGGSNKGTTHSVLALRVLACA
jgi:hypothetical protein